jgi:hypothetical protein
MDVLSHIILRGTGENYDKSQSGELVSVTRFEVSYRTEVQDVICRQACSVNERQEY